MLGINLVWAGLEWDTNVLVWTAFAPAWFSLAAAAYAWLTNKTPWAHVSVWLATLAGGLVIKMYSHGSGRSAALIACLAIAYVLAERALHQLALRPVKDAHAKTENLRNLRIDYRYWWLLYKRPLLNAGWVLSVAAIAAALVRNLILLGGGTTRQIWSIVALLLITGLYALSARLFRRVHFVWLAAGLVVVPWTLAVNLIWDYELAWFGLSWVVLALGLLGVGALLARRLGLGKWSWPPQVVAHAAGTDWLAVDRVRPGHRQCGAGVGGGFLFGGNRY